MDWFERLTGFREAPYHETRAKLEVKGNRLRSIVNQRSYQIGRLELVSLAELRARVASIARDGRVTVRNIVADVRELHRADEHTGALFQVASQFNLLEMTGPSVTPEDGVTRYASDPTQGPACAIAAGAATIYRNYFAPVADQFGQTAQHQLDGLADLGFALSEALGRPVQSLWDMRNGYALCHREGLSAIGSYLDGLLGKRDRSAAIAASHRPPFRCRSHQSRERHTVSFPKSFARVYPSDIAARFPGLNGARSHGLS